MCFICSLQILKHTLMNAFCLLCIFWLLAFAMCFQADGAQQKSEGSSSPAAVSPPLQADNGAKENGLKENSPTPLPSLGEGPRDSQGLDKRIPGTSKCKLGRFSPYMTLIYVILHIRILEPATFEFLSWNLNWIAYTIQEVELKF